MPATIASKTAAARSQASRVFDLDAMSLRELNQALHNLTPGSNETAWEVLQPEGQPLGRRRRRPAGQRSMCAAASAIIAAA